MEWIIGGIIGLLIGGTVCWFVQESRTRSKLDKASAQHKMEMTGLQARLEIADNAQQIIESAKTQMGETFRAAAADALSGNNQQFLSLANENFGRTMESAKGEFDRRHQQFQEMVKPLAENYSKLNPQIDSLMTQVQAATAETTKLSAALTDTRRVGNWGEVQLRRVVDLAGMTEYCDFTEQATGGSSQDRPDLIVTLPERRAVVVDAKASTAAYLEAQQADDDETAHAAWQKHAAALKRQVTELARKNYGQKTEGALDFVVMFVPGDQFLSAALNTDRDLLEYAMNQRVAIATPASLIAMLWAINNGWQQFRLAQGARQIKEVGEDMHKRMLTFIKHYQNVGKELKSAVTAFNESIGSFDERIVPKGRQFSEMVTGEDDRFEIPEAIDQSPRISRYATPPALTTEGDDQRLGSTNSGK